MTNRGSKTFAAAMLFVAMLSWAVSFPIVRWAMTEGGWGGHPFLLLAGRFWIAAAIFFPFVLKGEGAVKELVRHFKAGAPIAAALVPTFFLQYRSLGLLTSGEAAFITAVGTVLVPVGALVCFGKRVPWAAWVGLIAASTGLLVMEEATFTAGAWLGIGGAVGFAADMLLISYYRDQKKDGKPTYRVLPLLVAQFIVVAVACSALALVLEVVPKGIPEQLGPGLSAMVWLAVVATGVAFYLQTQYQPQAGEVRTAIIFSLEAVFAAIAAYLFRDEGFTQPMMIGGALVAAGVIFSEWMSAKDQPPDETLGSPMPCMATGN